VSGQRSPAAQKSLGVLAVVFLVFALERLVNAAMAGSHAGSRTAWLLSAAFALTGAVLLCGFLLMGGAAFGSPQKRRKG
jgi:hypothetical protein